MTWASRWRTLLLTVLTLLPGVLVGVAAPSPAHAATSTSITVDGKAPGLVFDGVGAISGGGGNSRLLADYPEPQRSQLLDYLFKPGYGASLQTLKIEIGGDTNSTDGAEASHEHTRGAVDCDQGYEWWLAEQAKARNPNIKLYGLAWGAPGWIGGGSFWSQDMIDYLMSWLGCAAKHNLNIDYLGGWNERDWNTGWYENLKSTLVAKGHGSIKVVAADNNWNVADAMASDPAFKNAVDIVGVHYPCGYNGSFTSCSSTPTARSLGKPLWASENGSEDLDGSPGVDSGRGAPAVARAINRDYIDGQMTSYINWPVVAALYPNLYFQTDGLSLANQPWSGHYRIGKTTWVTAHTTQFTHPGWRYVDSAKGYLGGDRANGSYVTLKPSNDSDYTTVIETMDATADQTATFTVTGGLPTGQVHVWATNLTSNNSADWFAHAQDVTPSGGKYTLTLKPGYVYTVTTMAGGGKGTATPAPSKSLALPYADDFDTAATTTSPKYFADMNGAFQTVPCGGRTGKCLRQMAPTRPIHWTDEKSPNPYTIMGDQTWSNYTVTVDALLESSSTVDVLGRVGQQGRNNNGLNAYHLLVGDSGAWSIQKSDTNWNWTTLPGASGKTDKPLGAGTWHRISLTMQGSKLSASIDGTKVGETTDASFAGGQAGLGVTDYKTAQFDNFRLDPGTATSPVSGPVAAGIAGKCLDDDRNAGDNGTHAQLWDCNRTGAQVWTWAGGTLTHNGKCLDVAGEEVANGTLAQLWDCNGGAHQQWSPQPDGTLKNVLSGRCLDDPEWKTVNGTQLEIWDCNGGANQKWRLPS
ncbi:ricin-type beta-trefoil lectin domain protein [Actinoallomurus sp. NPDC050550]|uniref:ricin-type beta-trefoil lectin domain protein n=1 Tax=Actinoallomurus sp. NPDC050550 TaxID=3154937 RepID=UPI0033E8E2E8